MTATAKIPLRAPMLLAFIVMYAACAPIRQAADVRIGVTCSSATARTTATFAAPEATSSISTASPRASPSPAGTAVQPSQILLRRYVHGEPSRGVVVQVDTGEVTLLPSGFSPISWSPDQQHLLLLGQADGGLYLASPDGSNMEPLLIPTGASATVNSWWVDLHTVLTELHPSDSTWAIVSVDTETRSVRTLGSTGQREVQAVDPTTSSWIDASMIGAERDLHLGTLDGGVSSILSGVDLVAYDVAIPATQTLSFLGKGTRVAYGATVAPRVANTPLHESVFVADIEPGRDAGSPIRILDLGEANVLRGVSVSPDGQLLAVMSDFLHVLDTDSLRVNFTWDVSDTWNGEGLVWSPDSSSIATRYRGPDFTDYVILLDVRSGDRTILLSEYNVMYSVLDWRSTEE